MGELVLWVQRIGEGWRSVVDLTVRGLQSQSWFVDFKDELSETLEQSDLGNWELQEKGNSLVRILFHD